MMVSIRPKCFDEVCGQDMIMENLKNQSKQERFFSNYMLEGQYGGGKTTTARILSKAFNCKNKDSEGNPCCNCSICISIDEERSMDVIEIDGASNNGVDKVREIIENSSFRPVEMEYKVYVIDEVHMLTTSAFNALLKTLESGSPFVKFIFCTTEPDKIPMTIRSRCARYTFKPIFEKTILAYLMEISKKHGVSIEHEGAALIAKYSNGSLRDALKYLDQAACGGKADNESIAGMFGVVGNNMIFTLISAIMAVDKNGIVSILKQFYDDGGFFRNIRNGILEILSDCIMVSSSCGDTSELCNTDTYIGHIKEICRISTIEKLMYLADSFLNLNNEHFKSLPVFMLQVMKIALCEGNSMTMLLSRISELESRMNQIDEGIGYGKHVGICDYVAGMEENIYCEEDKDVALVPDDDIRSDAGGMDMLMKELLNSCMPSENEENVYHTPFMPVYRMIQKFSDACLFSGRAVFNPTINISRRLI